MIFMLSIRGREVEGAIARDALEEVHPEIGEAAASVKQHVAWPLAEGDYLRVRSKY
jgi:hypothetical protein